MTRACYWASPSLQTPVEPRGAARYLDWSSGVLFRTAR